MSQKRLSSCYANSAAAMARRFGITIKTLRHYEKTGLIKPQRDQRGWRIFDQTDCERLHLILLLRRFDLSLSRIGVLLSSGTPDIETAIAMQERILLDERARIDKTLSLLKTAKTHLTSGQTLDPVTLADLVRTQPLQWYWPDRLNMLASRYFDRAQCRHLVETAPGLGSEWSKVLNELNQLGAHISPDDPKARPIGTKVAHLVAIMTKGDPSFLKALELFWKAGFAQSSSATLLPLSLRQWQFLGAAMQAHWKNTT